MSGIILARAVFADISEKVREVLEIEAEASFPVCEARELGMGVSRPG
jgi:hypothetical protein